jgi:hypothetical protein
MQYIWEKSTNSKFPYGRVALRAVTHPRIDHKPHKIGNLTKTALFQQQYPFNWSKKIPCVNGEKQLPCAPFAVFRETHSLWHPLTINGTACASRPNKSEPLTQNARRPPPRQLKSPAKLVSHSPRRSATREYLSESAAAWTCAAHLSLFESEREQLARCWSRDSKIVCLLLLLLQTSAFTFSPLAHSTASEMLIGGELFTCIFVHNASAAAIISLSTRDLAVIRQIKQSAREPPDVSRIVIYSQQNAVRKCMDAALRAQR